MHALSPIDAALSCGEQLTVLADAAHIVRTADLLPQRAKSPPEVGGDAALEGLHLLAAGRPKGGRLLVVLQAPDGRRRRVRHLRAELLQLCTRTYVHVSITS